MRIANSINLGGRIHSIQALRSVAVLAVVVLHSKGAVTHRLFEIPFLSQFGWLGVRLFFVISGFIIAERIRCETNLVDYLYHRYARIFPLYAAVTLTSAAISFFVGRALFLAQRTLSGEKFAPDSVYLLKSLFIVPQDEWPAFMVGWSLEYEIVFYALFGFAYFFRGPAAAIGLIVALSGIGTLFPEATKPFFDSLFVYFLGGVLAREVFARRFDAAIASAPVTFISTAIFAVLHLYKIIDVGSVAFEPIAATSFSALLIWWVGLEKANKAFTRPTIWTKIGDISFSLYLVHWLVFPVCKAVFWGQVQTAVEAEGLRALAVGLSVALSWLTWKYIEVPLTRHLRRKGPAATVPSS